MIPTLAPVSLPQHCHQVFEFARVQIRNGRVRHAGCRPRDDVISLACRSVRIPVRGRRPGEDVDYMLPALIYERGDGTAAEIVQPSAAELETAIGEILH